jgi:hypothetical protein
MECLKNNEQCVGKGVKGEAVAGFKELSKVFLRK